jgi:hypothetical protein
MPRRAFYDALTKCDLEAMMAVWGDDDDVYCVHPNGARIMGVEQVRSRGARSSRAASVFRSGCARASTSRG